MMKTLKIFLVVIAASLLVSSCGIHSNLSQNANLNQSEVVLSQANYHIVNTVEVQFGTLRVLGIGALSKEAVRSNVIAELSKKANLKGSQALINVNIKQSNRWFVVFSKQTYTATANVIEFDK